MNIVSRASFKGKPTTGPYAAAKGGMLAFSRSMALDLGEYGITVNNVAPGYVETPMTITQSQWTSEEARVEAQVREGVVTRPMRFALPEEIAQAVLYFCGPNSGHTTGCTIHVNGGSYMD